MIMKQWLAIVALSVVLSSCAAFNAATIGDDMYSAHSRTEIANRQKAAAEAARAEAEARQAEWEAKLAQAKALAAASSVSRTWARSRFSATQTLPIL